MKSIWITIALLALQVTILSAQVPYYRIEIYETSVSYEADSFILDLALFQQFVDFVDTVLVSEDDTLQRLDLIFSGCPGEATWGRRYYSYTLARGQSAIKIRTLHKISAPCREFPIVVRDSVTLPIEFPVSTRYNDPDASVEVYPNPVRGTLYVRPGPGVPPAAEKRLYGKAGGRLVLTTTRDAIDVSGLPPGLYVLAVAGRAGWVTRKVVVE